MKHLDLFSGIGGAALAVDSVWPGAEHVFCEIDPFCQQVLKKHWPNEKVYSDIKTLAYADFFGWKGSNLLQQGRFSDRGGSEVDLLTGGFPCQPFSQAGRRKGTEDDRHLWPQMFRVIREFRPTWVVGENVAGLLSIGGGLVFEQVCLDLESEGYEVQTLVIPAVAVNAPHRRDRVWIVGHAEHDGRDGTEDGKSGSEGSERNEKGQEQVRQSQGAGGLRDDAADGDRKRLERRPSTNLNNKNRKAFGVLSAVRHQDRGNNWDENWLEVAQRFCKLDDGVSDRLVALPNGEKISQSRWRKEALKGLGNAWVPQVAEEIFKAIKKVESLTPKTKR